MTDYKRKIIIFNGSSVTNDDVKKWYGRVVDLVSDVSKVLSEDEEIENFISNPFEIINHEALVVVDDFAHSKWRDWNALVNKILTSSERLSSNFSLIICTRSKLTKTLMRKKEVKILNKLQ